jgi:hypothetical protein
MAQRAGQEVRFNITDIFARSLNLNCSFDQIYLFFRETVHWLLCCLEQAFSSSHVPVSPRTFVFEHFMADTLFHDASVNMQTALTDLSLNELKAAFSDDASVSIRDLLSGLNFHCIFFHLEFFTSRFILFQFFVSLSCGTLAASHSGHAVAG